MDKKLERILTDYFKTQSQMVLDKMSGLIGDGEFKVMHEMLLKNYVLKLKDALRHGRKAP